MCLRFYSQFRQSGDGGKRPEMKKKFNVKDIVEDVAEGYSNFNITFSVFAKANEFKKRFFFVLFSFENRKFIICIPFLM